MELIVERDGRRFLMDRSGNMRPLPDEPQATLSAYEPTVTERWRWGLADMLRDGLGMSTIGARDVSERILGKPFAGPETDALTGFLDGMGIAGATGFSAIPEGLQAVEDYQRGNYGDAALGGIFTALEAAPLIGAGAKVAGNAVRGGLDDLIRFAADDYGGVRAPGKGFGEGWADVYHWSRSPDDFSEFDLSKSTGSTSRLGPHVGTQRAAEDRFQGWEEPTGFTMPLRADLSMPFNNPSNSNPWTELDLEMFISAMADEHGIDRRDVPPLMRQRLAAEGYTSIPYINDVEDPGSVSHIMLTDRPDNSSAVLRSRFARFDPRHAHLKNLSAAVAFAPFMGLLSQDEQAQ